MLGKFRDKLGEGGDEQDDDSGDVAENVMALHEQVKELEAENQAGR